MRLIRILTAVGIVGGGLFLAIPAQASGPPGGSCADGYALRSASIAPSADLNGDGLVCLKILNPHAGFAIIIDNTVQG
jgi:hypothetical protein